MPGVDTQTQLFRLRGMSCAACAQAVESVISKVGGVESCAVNFGAAQATVTYNSTQVGTATIESAVIAAGYGAEVIAADNFAADQEALDAEHHIESRQLNRKVAVSLVIASILVVGSIPMMTISLINTFSRTMVKMPPFPTPATSALMTMSPHPDGMMSLP